MTHCILSTDIELAKRLLEASRPDSAIVAALVQRGIDSASASQLVANLREGRQVVPQIPDGLEISSRRRSRSKRAASPSEPSHAEHDPDTNPQTQRAAERHTETRKSASPLWLLAAVGVCFLAVIIGVLISNHLHRAAEEATSAKPQPAAPARAAAAPAATSQKAPPAGAQQVTVPKTGAGAQQPIPASISNAPAPQAH